MASVRAERTPPFCPNRAAIRIAPLPGEGHRELSIPTPAGGLGVSDRAAAGRHVVTTSARARFRLEVVGGDAAALEHRLA